MGGGRGDMNCVGRRTRRKWDDYYEKLCTESKREDLKCDVAGGSDKRVKIVSESKIVDEGSHDVVDSSERDCDSVVILGRGEFEDDAGVEILGSDEEDGDEILEIGEDEFHGVEILKCVKDEYEYEDDGGGGGGGGGGGILVKDEAEDDDDGIEILNEEDDESVSSLNDGENEAKGFEKLQAGGGEDDEDGGGGGGGGGILKRDEDEDEPEDDDDDDGIEILRSEEGDDSVSSLNNGENEAKGFEKLQTSGEEEEEDDQAQTEPMEVEQIYEHISVNSEVSESESESSSDDGMDELSHDDYKEDESSTSESSEEMQSHGNGENENLVKEREKLSEKDDKGDDDEQQRSDNAGIISDKKKQKSSMNRKKESRGELEHEECSSTASAMDEELEPSNDVERFFTTREAKSKVEEAKFTTKKSHSVRDLDLIKILVDSIDSLKHKQYTIDEKALAENLLPLKFKFEDEAPPPPEKSEWEKHMDSMFCDLELGLREAEADCSGFSKMGNEDSMATEKIEESQAVLCRRGKHVAILDEEIGIVCEFCLAVIMDIKHILPPFVRI